MVKPLIALLAALWCLGLAAPAHAGICDRFLVDLSERDLTAVRDRVRGKLPSRYAPQLSKVTLLYGENYYDRLSPPAANMPIDGSPPRIEIPRGFRHLQCQALLISNQLLELQPVDVEQVRAMLQSKIADCVKRQPAGTCLARAVGAAAAASENRKPFSDKDNEIFQIAVEESFEIVVAHEMAHIVLSGDTKLNRRTFSPDAELAADNLSQSIMLANGGYPSAGLATLAVLSLVDSVTTQGADADHPSSYCRTLIADRVAHLIGGPSRLIYLWLVNPSRYAQERRANGPEIRSFPALSPGNQCSLPNFRPTQMMKEDLDRFLVHLDRFTLNSSKLSEPQQLETLLRFKPKSQDSEVQISSFLSLWLAYHAKPNSGQGDLAEKSALLTMYRKALSQTNLPMVSSDARGRLLFHASQLEFDLAPLGSSTDEQVRIHKRALDEAEFYQPDAGFPFHFAQGNMAVMTGNCLEAARRYRLILSAMPNPPQAERALADKLDSMNGSECATLAAATREKIGQMKGWK